jgi:hypothetical protein
MQLEPIMERHKYVKDVLSKFCLASSTWPRIGSKDLLFAQELYNRDVPVAAVEAALVLTDIRRRLPSPESPQLAPIRSFTYFRPVIEEVLTTPPDLGSLFYLNNKLEQLEEHHSRDF